MEETTAVQAINLEAHYGNFYELYGHLREALNRLNKLIQQRDSQIRSCPLRAEMLDMEIQLHLKPKKYDPAIYRKVDLKYGWNNTNTAREIKEFLESVCQAYCWREGQPVCKITDDKQKLFFSFTLDGVEYEYTLLTHRRKK